MSQYNNKENSSYGLILCGDQLDTRLDSWLVLKSTIRRLNKAMIESFFVLWLGNWFETRAGTVVILYHTFLSSSITWDDFPLIECHFETSIYLTFFFSYPAGSQCPFLTSLMWLLPANFSPPHCKTEFDYGTFSSVFLRSFLDSHWNTWQKTSQDLHLASTSSVHSNKELIGLRTVLIWSSVSSFCFIIEWPALWCILIHFQ